MKINVKEVGVGTPINPHQFTNDFNIYNPAYDRFEKAHPELPALYIKGNKLPVGEYEVELVWQHNDGISWNNQTSEQMALSPIGQNYSGFFRQVYIASVAPESKEEIKDASHYKILGNLPGKEQDGINPDLLDLWGECENFYGDPHKNETGRQLLKRLETIYNVSKQLKEPAIDEAVNLDWLNDSLLNKLSVDRYGDNPNSFGQQRDGFKVGYKQGYTAALSTSKQPEKEVDTIEQAADKYRKSVKDINPIGYYNEPGYNGFIAGAYHIKSTHVPIEEVENILRESYKEKFNMGLYIVLQEIRNLIKPQ